MTEFKIGSSSGGTTNFSALSTPVKEPARTLFYPYSKQVLMASGITVGVGSPCLLMQWDSMTRAQRDVLKSFAAAKVYIYVPTNESSQTFGYFSGYMQWPVTEKWQLGNILDLEIRINRLVTYTP